jgi:mono/diheme cytochrome c family protein
VPEPPWKTPPRSAKLLVLLAGMAALSLLGGCSFTQNADKQRGRTLFIQKCGTCHALAQAGTQATVGPNLDAAFAQARADGMDADTIAGVTAAQIEFPRPSTDNPKISMPANLVEGGDVADVAAYVGSVAGVPGIKPPVAPGGPGGQVFANNGCGSCHILKAAASSGTTGPDLDKVLAGQSPSDIEQSIVDPNAKIAAGYPPNVMPETFKSLPPEQLKQLVDFLVKSVGGGSATGTASP